MIDRREAILAQLLAIATAVPGVTTAARNRLSPSDQETPSIIIYDGDENIVEGDDEAGSTRRPPDKPRRLIMVPLIEVLLGDATATAGSSINAIRVALLAAILTDATLASLTQDQGRGIHYHGCTFGAGLGRSLEANMVLNFSFTYPLRAQELQ